jgi:hypothetical protein
MGTLSTLTAAQWEVLATHDFGDEIYATPVPLDDGLYVRTRSHLYRFRAAPPTY